MNKPTLAVNILTRNAGRLVIRAIESVGPIDEVVIIDTGSTDDSKKVLGDYLQECAALKKYSIVDFSPKTHSDFYVSDTRENFPGLSLEDSEYTGRTMLIDFAAARQEGLAHTTSDFVFYLDSDDVIKSPDSFGEIPKVVAYLDRHGKDLGITPYVHRFATTTALKTPCSVMARSSFGRVGKVRWEGAVHEHLVNAPYGEESLNEVLFEAPVTLDLFDRADPGSRAPWRNLKILHRAFFGKSYDRSPHVLFHLGLETRRIFPQKSLNYFKLFIDGLSALKRSRRTASAIATAHVERGRIYEMLEKPTEAFGEYANACNVCRDLPESYFGLGRASYRLESYAQAVNYIQEGQRLAKDKKTEFFMHDPIEREGKSRIFLALSLARLGKHGKALSVWNEGKSVLPEEFAALKNILDRSASNRSETRAEASL